MTTKLLVGPCKQELNCLGSFTAELQVQGKVTTEQVCVIQDLERAFLGRAVAERLKLISRLGMKSPNMCDLTMVLILIAQNAPTLPVNRDLNTPRVVQYFNSQMEKLSVES